MKIWLHRYHMQPREPKLTPRRGALMKVEWVAGQFGFSDLHPWPEFGEPDLDQQIESLRTLQMTPLAEASLEFNYQDCEFRRLKRNAFLGLILPRAHRLVFDLESLEADHLSAWKGQGYSHIKVKMGRDLTRETAIFAQLAYATNMLWRLDFNGRIAAADFKIWWTQLDPALKARIDFIEDPTAEGDLNLVGPWANDWKKQLHAPIRVVKPSRERLEDLAQFDRVIFTHSLEHTFGQVCSLWAAARFYSQHPRRLEVCGLGSVDFFSADEFSREWHCAGPRMKPTTGTGFGFDTILNGLAWERLF